MELSNYYDLFVSLRTKYHIGLFFVPAGRHFRLILITLLLTVCW